MNPRITYALITGSEFSGLDAAGIAAKVNSDFRTAAPIPIPALRNYMGDEGLLTGIVATLSTPTFAGVCQSLGLNPTLTGYAVSSAIEVIKSPAPTLDTTDSARATKTYNLLQLMIAINSQDATAGMTPTQAAAILELGGDIVLGPGSATEAEIVSVLAQGVRVAAIALRKAEDAARFNANEEKLAKMLADPTITVPDSIAALDAMVL